MDSESFLEQSKSEFENDSEASANMLDEKKKNYVKNNKVVIPTFTKALNQVTRVTSMQ